MTDTTWNVEYCPQDALGHGIYQDNKEQTRREIVLEVEFLE